MKDYEKILDEWHDKVTERADKYLNKVDDFEIGSAKAIQYKNYADGMYMALAMLSRIERKYKDKGKV